jgi:spore coat protein U-like protein
MGLREAMTGSRPYLAILAAALAAAPSVASAKPTMVIASDVQRSCHLGVLPMMFGTVSILFPNATTQTPVFIDCTPNTDFTVAMDNGLNFNGQRRMRRVGGANLYLTYEIYRNAARTQRWGSTVATSVSGTAPVGGKVTLYAYGRANGLFAMASPYEDLVTVTITF